MKRLPLILIALVWAACTSPVKVNNEIQVAGSKLLYQADNFTKIKALSVSPKDGKVAFISQKTEFDLVTVSSATLNDEQTLTENLFDIQSGGEACLSAQANKLAVLHDGKIVVHDMVSKEKHNYSLAGKHILQGKWSGSEGNFYVLTEDSLSANRQISRLNLSDGSVTILFSGTENVKFFDVNSAQNTFCFYEESVAGRRVVFTLRGRAEPDSFSLERPARLLAIAHNGRQILWTIKSAPQSFKIFIYDALTGTTEFLLQIEQEVLAVKWSPDDSKILLLHPHGLSVFSLQNYKIVAAALFADSSNEVRMSPQWTANAAKICFIRKKFVNRLNLFTLSAGSPFRTMRIKISKDYSMDWDGDGRRVLLNEQQSVIIYDPETNRERKLKLPLHAVTPVRWGGPQGSWLTYVSGEEDEQQLILMDGKTGQLKQYAMKGIYPVKDIAWLHGYEYISFILPQKQYMLIFGFGSDELQKIKVAPGDIRKVCWAPDEAPLASLSGDYAAVQGQKALGIYYYNTNYIYWLSHLTPLNAAYFAWNRDGKNLIYVSSEDAGAQQVFMEQVIYLNN